MIRFDLAAPANIELAVYNAAGQRVRTLFSGAQNAGAHTLTWDGLTDNGRSAASGVYLYRFSTDSKIEQRKMLLLR